MARLLNDIEPMVRFPLARQGTATLVPPIVRGLVRLLACQTKDRVGRPSRIHPAIYPRPLMIDQLTQQNDTTCSHLLIA